MIAQVEVSQRTALITAFGIKAADRHTSNWLNDFIACDEYKLVDLARYLGIPIPGESHDEQATADDEVIQTAHSIDTYSQLVAAETALREIVRLTMGRSWLEDFTHEKVAALEAKRDEEDKRRDGVSVSQDLLDYTEAYHLESLILKHWDKTRPVLQDKKRTEVYLKLLLSVRNTIAHARPVAPFERQLLAGIAGQVQNLISLYRSGSETADAYYASINYVRDSFCDEVIGGDRGAGHLRNRRRLQIGQVVAFELSATDPYDREITWNLHLYDSSQAKSTELGIALGSEAIFEWTVREEHVGEQVDVYIAIENESNYQRHGTKDDEVSFGYAVSPPVPRGR